jgi:hypothetical protein
MAWGKRRRRSIASAVVAQLSSTRLTNNVLVRPSDRGRVLVHAIQPPSQLVAAAHAGVAAARLHKREIPQFGQKSANAYILHLYAFAYKNSSYPIAYIDI